VFVVRVGANAIHGRDVPKCLTLADVIVCGVDSELVGVCDACDLVSDGLTTC
jgi:hypothetical protein